MQAYGKCNETWMVQGSFCLFSCGRCPRAQLPSAPSACKTVAATIRGLPELSTWYRVLERANLTGPGVLDDPTVQLTVFSPTNAAFDSLLQTRRSDGQTLDLEALLNGDNRQLAFLSNNHLLTDVETYSIIRNNSRYPTLLAFSNPGYNGKEM